MIVRIKKYIKPKLQMIKLFNMESNRFEPGKYKFDKTMTYISIKNSVKTN